MYNMLHHQVYLQGTHLFCICSSAPIFSIRREPNLSANSMGSIGSPWWGLHRERLPCTRGRFPHGPPIAWEIGMDETSTIALSPIWSILLKQESIYLLILFLFFYPSLGHLSDRHTYYLSLVMIPRQHLTLGPTPSSAGFWSRAGFS